MNKSSKFSPEVRERAVRMVQEHRDEYPSLWSAVESLAPKTGGVPHTLYEWVRKHEVDSGTRAGITTAEHDRVKALERENPDGHPKSPTLASGSCTLFLQPVRTPPRFH